MIRATAPGQTAPAASGDSVVTLNPFEVNSDQDKSYGAVNSTTITRFNAELDKLPISADVFTDAFIKDTASQSVEQMIQTYSAGAGFTSSDPGGNAATGQPLDRNPSNGLSLRGLGNTQQERDGFFPTLVNAGTGFTSTFDLDRAEVINGPQALLYGAGGAGGVVNVVSKRARFGSNATGTTQFQVDQFGDRMAQTDYGVGTDQVAFRTAIIEQSVGGRRANIGGDVHGYYAQVAIRPFKNTIVRIGGEQTTYDRINSTSLVLTAASTSNDARNGDYLHYLLATHQVQAAAHGAPSGAGPIDNGNLNWNNVDSFGGWWASELTVNEWAELIAETEWAPWLSTQASFAYNNHVQDYVNNSPVFTAPNVAANPLTGQWAAGLTAAIPDTDIEQPGRSKTMRVSALITHQLFSGRMKSQTAFGFDDVSGTAGQVAYSYFQADSGFNVVLNSALTTTQGRTALTKPYWPIGGGPMGYPYWAPRATRITLNGTNYVRQMINPPNHALISPNDPLGVGLGGAIYQHIQLESSGIYGLNYLQWDERKIDTLVGFRLARSFEQTMNQGSAPPANANPVQTSRAHTLSFSAGADYAVLPWLRPYVAASDSFLPPTTQLQDPYGKQPKTANALGEEIGIKANSSDNTLSGSIAIYHTDSKNEQYTISSSLESDINPTGLNGRFGTPSNWINVRRESQGVQTVVTAAPTTAWRLRLSAAVTNGKIGSSTAYGQLYNDQFHENAAGQVTYADGTVVYVPPTFNSKTLTEASTVSGAIPLTVTALSTPGNAYYASPQNITGQILSTSNGAKVLETVSATHGAILTGQTGLPISALQINPALANISIPGTVVTSRSGDVTTGYPEISATFTGVYTVPTGYLKGLQVGGSVLAGWFTRGYYFYSNGVNPTAHRTLYDNPNTFQVDGIFGYRRKFGRFVVRSQLNVSNLFNHYHIVILPNTLTGWSTPVGVNATFIQQPRTYVWTNTLQY